jgi:transcriptional regulator with XRE-family HTH domain
MGARLQAVRVERELTKAALARLAEISPSAFAKIENGNIKSQSSKDGTWWDYDRPISK